MYIQAYCHRNRWHDGFGDTRILNADMRRPTFETQLDFNRKRKDNGTNTASLLGAQHIWKGVGRTDIYTSVGGQYEEPQWKDLGHECRISRKCQVSRLSE